ncbi:Na(+)/H(+) antiporter subunit B [Cyanobium sp. NS01]|uniref:Na(+)/H(+) antiporter subunit B n=1 Tax=Cyanobium sp. NS01 TaxID=261284 RepID=UPI001645B598|nr:Na(+)/H(+) antiporter subunit B [Cyanobium sp. NS01]QNI70287.1 multiprotein Na+/H+ antiporter/ subunit B [Cyanobium sp. NS01]
MNWVYALAAVMLCLAPLALAMPEPAPLDQVLELLLRTGDVPNLVATVILETRLYDTVSEVVVFTLASIGVRWIFSGEPSQRRIRGLQDAPSVVLCQLGSTVCALVAVELALRGHLSPGGGFAAGVSGGTAIGLLLISGSVRLADRLYQRYRADLWEKAAVVAFLLVALLSLEGLVPWGSGSFGTIDSGGWIPLLNVLVAVKVTLGSWAMVQLLVRYRGLL